MKEYFIWLLIVIVFINLINKDENLKSKTIKDFNKKRKKILYIYLGILGLLAFATCILCIFVLKSHGMEGLLFPLMIIEGGFICMMFGFIGLILFFAHKKE